MKNIRYVTLLVSIGIGISGCLKTRAQLREDSDNRPVAAPPIHDVQPQGQYVIDELKSEMTQQLGRIEDLEREQKELISKGSGASSEELKKLEARIASLEQTQTHLLEVMEKVQVMTSLKDPDELFKKAKAQYDDEEYEAAAEAFGSYLKAPKIKKAEEAIFFRGESYFKIKQYKKAIVEFSKFPEKFTRSSRMPEALYKIGLSFDALGMKEDAKGFYQELVEKYPKSPEAKKMKKGKISHSSRHK